MSLNHQILRQLDQFDLHILKVLSHDGRISVTELSDRVGLSKSPCQVRLKRLQSEGYIKGFRAELNAQMLGLEHVAFAEVKLRDTSERSLNAFNAAVGKITEVEQCHMIAGQFDYLLKVRTKDIQAYRRVLGEQISTLPNVLSTSTYVSMQSVKESGMLVV
ncbi:Lrp/AsnC family transcriptional regulator [Leucothrix mucor]|uniref:Lrp/AsnC family transcriptional regulator n=1 Tax=Leucothrix mucor TaxID=45248 RepID=UPI0003B6D906|nr:Lrp/AsnC ligand binding domain-containing protein [Leucothrix mucor]